jgi:uncharacterized LabA/DUF88 family protein
MKPSAVLLIDLENFYLSREDYLEETKGPGYDRTRFGEDLEKLLGFARAMAEGLPFTVKRAYANYQAWRPYADKTRDFYLRLIPDELMQQGVEPVQVFRLSQGRPGPGGKNAADMRMAMDATALLNGVGNVEHFVLVTGDADFIPVILELKRHGHTVSVIGVTGATNELIQRFVDNFELFEDLLDAERFAARNGDLAATDEGLAPVGEAIRNLLGRTGRVRFKILKPLLPLLLKHAFDPGAFGCETTLDFLRKYATELGVVIRPVQNDFEIDLPGAMAPFPNGIGGTKTAPRPAPRQPEKQPKQPARQPARPAKSPTRLPEPHTPAHYAHLLAGHATGITAAVRVPAVPWSVLVWGCEAVVPALTPPTGGPATSIELLPRLNAAAAAVIPERARHVRFIYPILRAGLPVPGADGVYSVPQGTTGAEVRRRVLQYIAYVLNCRLGEHGVAGPIRPEVLAAVFEPGPDLEDAIREVEAALHQPTAAPEAAAPPAAQPGPARNVEDVHTPTSYQKLLKGGGAKGTENAALKINLAPWPVVERVCADAIPVLNPVAGGGPVSRDLLQARLTEAGKDLCIENYLPLARRVATALLVAGELQEADGVIALNPDVTSAQELRNRLLSFALQLLQLRLEERGITEPIRPQVFAAAVEAGPLTDSLVTEIAPAIAWLYQSTPGDPELIAEPELEPVGEIAEVESAAEHAPELVAGPMRQPTAPGALDIIEPALGDCGPDSGVVEVGAEIEVGSDDSSVQLLAPTRKAEEHPTAPPAPRKDPDEYAFDGDLSVGAAPGAAAPPAEPPVAHVRSEPAPAEFSRPEPDEPLVSAEPETVPLADITSEAVAAAEPSPKLPFPGRVAPEFVAPEPEPEPGAPAPPESDPAPTQTDLETISDDVILAVQVSSDWISEGEPYAEDLEFPPDPPAPEHLVSPPPRSAIIRLPQPVSPPPPLTGTRQPQVAKIVPPPPPPPETP